MRFTGRSGVCRRPRASVRPQAWATADQHSIRHARNTASDIFVRGKAISVHGRIYAVQTGPVNDLGVTAGGLEAFDRLAAPWARQTGPYSAVAA